MSEELQTIPYAPAQAPTLEILSGQFLFRAKTPNGAIHEKLISAASVREAFTGVNVDSGWLSPEVRRWGTGKSGDWAVLFIPPGTQTLELMPDKPDGQVEKITVALPGLVMFGISVKYFLYAMKTPELQPYETIYRAPLPNVEPDGAICFGTHKPPRCTATSIKQAWQIFIQSPFNNHRCDGKSKAQPEDVRIVLQSMGFLASGQAVSPEAVQFSHKYPVEDLVRQAKDTGATLDQMIRAFFESGEMQG